MIRVVIESPLAGDTEANIAYAKRCMLDCLRRGEAPYASHLLYAQPGILDDLKHNERALGIEAGLVWCKSAEKIAVYVDRGISTGMRLGITSGRIRGIPIEIRAIDREVTDVDRAEVDLG